MDDRRFDDLTRTLGRSLSRRAALKGGAAGLLGVLGLRRETAAQVTQAQCGNVLCKDNPGGCASGCVCCVYPNGNSRCRPPGTCSGGTEVVPATTTTTAPTTTAMPTTTVAPTTTATPTTSTPTTTPAPTTTAPPATTTAPTTTPAPTTTSAPTATTTTTAPPTGVCSGQPNSTSCIPDNRCVQGATCQNGACTGGTATVCEQPTNLCHDAVCDPATGTCVDTALSFGVRDTKGCAVCLACFDGECGGGVQRLDCGSPCLTCDPSLGACIAIPAGADCGSTCTARAACRADGVCVVTPNTIGCVNVDFCQDIVCDSATGGCVETGSKNGQACGDDSCRECRNGQCAPKQCGACERCQPGVGCVTCSPCCNGICGQTTCGTNCCGPDQACCTGTAGLSFCQPPDTVCEGKCFGDPVVCCGRTPIFGRISTCPIGHTCCGPGNDVCCPPGQTCGAFICVTA